MQKYPGNAPAPSKVEEFDMSASYTAKDYVKWHLEELIELIRGKIVRMSPASNTNNQSVLMELSVQLGLFFEKHSCRVFVAPFDVYLVYPGESYLDAENIVEPDFCVICDQSK